MFGKKQLREGDVAPDFELPDQTGALVRLSDVVQRANAAVVYFYPRDDTPGCTLEAIEFREKLSDFAALGAEVLGISGDTVESHRCFADKHTLTFRLLSDAGEAVRTAYGVGKTLGVMPGRVTFVIDRERRIRHVFSSQLRATAHVREALDDLRKLAQQTASATVR
jgi:peroxiredoxin Q/BCP